MADFFIFFYSLLSAAAGNGAIFLMIQIFLSVSAINYKIRTLLVLSYRFKINVTFLQNQNEIPTAGNRAFLLQTPVINGLTQFLRLHRTAQRVCPIGLQVNKVRSQSLVLPLFLSFSIICATKVGIRVSRLATI